MCVTGICFWQHRADFVRRVILCWRQYGIGTKPGFLAIENWAGEAQESRHSMVVSNAMHRARLLKADPYPAIAQDARAAMRLTGGAAARLAKLVPPGYEADIHVSITDEYPLAQAFVIISAEPRTGS